MDKAKLKAFVAACEADPSGLPKLVFADWLEENGDHDAAAGLRWCVKHGRWPIHNEAHRCWRWFVKGFHESMSNGRRRMPFVACWLPDFVGREMMRQHAVASRTWLIAVRRVGWAVRRIWNLVSV